MIIDVSSSASLTSALKSAHAGDTIRLAAGNYGGVNIWNYKFSGEVTIVSADPSHPAVIAALNVQGVTNLTIRDVEIDAPPKILGAYVANSTNIKLDQLDVHNQSATDLTRAETGIALRSATNVTITNSEFHDLTTGIAHKDVNGLVVDGNSLHNLANDGIQGSGSSNVTITKNFFTNMMSGGQAHHDAIQFFTTGTTTAQKNITITDNVYVRGDGQVVQGIFMGNELGIAYENVTIARNAFMGAAYHGITIDKAVNVTLTDNLVAGYRDMTSWIQLTNATNSSATNNTATSYKIYSNTNTVTSNNVWAEQQLLGDNSLLTTWQNLAGHLNIDGVLKDQFVADQPAVITDPVIVKVAPVTVTGTANADNLAGNTGDDRIDGAAGSDTMSGGYGDDTYFVDAAGDKIVENARYGVDTVMSRFAGAYALGENVENAVAIASSNQTLYGNDMANVLVASTTKATFLGGGFGADTLVSTGGDDGMQGGSGNDVFRWEAMPRGDTNILDFTPEADRLDVRPLLKGYTGTNPLADGYIKFTTVGADAQLWVDRDGSAGSGAATLVATLKGAGSYGFKAGVDYLWKSDAASEQLSTYVQSLQAKAGVTAPVTSPVAAPTSSTPPPATTTPTSSTPPPTTTTPTSSTPTTGTSSGGVSLVGTSNGDNLTGGAGNDTLDGKAGADTLTGGAGNDSYVVDISTDKVIEAVNGGIDTMKSLVSTCKLAANVENGVAIGTGSQTILGNDLNNVISGSRTGSTYLNGWGGNDTLVSTGGDDIMAGGTGADVFRWDGLPRGDTLIADFKPGEDRLDLHSLLPNYTGSNAVADGFVKFVASAYDTQLWVDVDGSQGAAGFTLVATLTSITSPLRAGVDWVI